MAGMDDRQPASVGAVATSDEAGISAKSAPLIVGVSGARRNAAAAAVVNGRLVGFCEQERVIRVRAVPLQPGRLPAEAIDAALRHVDTRGFDDPWFVAAESDVHLARETHQDFVDHHLAHAATAVLTSPHRRAVVLVCDQHGSPPLTVWTFREGRLARVDWPWAGDGFAALYSKAVRLFGFEDSGEHQLESWARLDPGTPSNILASMLAYRDGSLVVADAFWPTLESWVADATPASVAAAAAAFQHTLGEALVTLVREIRTTVGGDALCLGGGLFYNTYLNTRVASCGAFAEVFVPVNPGNPGVATGAALVCGQGELLTANEASPFLGPEYSPPEVKQVLDNCKLTYEYCSDAETIGLAGPALCKGQIVAWFQGRMEWGHRALGNRSILANPFAPHVLEHLNAFLKHRDRHRAFGLSVVSEDAAQYFDVPALSPFMELEYTPRDPRLFTHIMPPGARTVRVQTVAVDSTRFCALHRAFGARSGHGVL